MNNTIIRKTVVGLAALLFAVAPVAAQEVGKTEWNGYPVVLNADGTWYFDCGGYGATLSKAVRMAFCFDPEFWTPVEQQDPQEFVTFSKDDTYGLGLITEAEVIAPDDLHAAVLANAAANAKTTVDKVDASDAPPLEINGRTWTGTHYNINTGESEFSYLNYHISGDAFGTAQVVFFTLKGNDGAIAEQAKAFLEKVVFGG